MSINSTTLNDRIKTPNSNFNLFYITIIMVKYQLIQFIYINIPCHPTL